ncbi:hypothetical protein [Fimbriiglobus ruber]|uniref:Uncharacterized protein n=1 Tax=Fimbriiglobus ruber TaxID=1908690 RepID=A0A225CYC8_9BACT|nr:hypothetical protein [Fimbriiglobus ruber]OWK34242.1 hypothetical protein FRUB_10213 [Fimbriiglobus ruber]
MPPNKKKPGPRVNPDSKRSKGEDRHKQPRKAFHADPKLFQALDKYVDETRPQPTESSVLRDALEEYLNKRGYWPPKDGT